MKKRILLFWRFSLTTLLSMSLSACVTDDIALIQTHDIIEQKVLRLFVLTDEKNWPEVEALFTEKVTFDMTSIVGGDPVIKDAKAIVADWQRGLDPITAIHHQVSNFRTRIDGDTATVRCYGTATHYRPHPTGRNTRTFVGTYEIGLKREETDWRIDRFQFNLKFVDGNLKLHEE